MTELTTERLLLRQWRDDDLAPFAALNADPEVMRYFAAPLTRAQSGAFLKRAYSTIYREGWGLWAVEVRDGAPLIGFVGLNSPSFDAHFTPALWLVSCEPRPPNRREIIGGGRPRER